MSKKSRKPGDAGVAAVEVALLIPLFILLIFGIMEFGLVWYLKHTITNASREGARYGIVYRTTTVGGVTTRQDPRNFSPSIETVVDNYLLQFFGAKFWTVPAPTLALGTGTSIPDAGNDLTVTVTAPVTWPFLTGLVPGLETITISAATSMKLE